MNTETPLFDELEAKWNAVGEDLLELIEDDEGNEVFPEPPTQTDLNEGVDLTAYLVPNGVKEGDTVTPVKLGEPQYSPGGYIGQFPELHKAIFEDRTYCPVSNVAVDRPKRKFKLFGRNQGTNGTL